jgi:hemolysin activation/secretion protein
MNTSIPHRNVGLIRPLFVSALLALGAGSITAQTLPNAGQLLNEIQKSDRESLPRTEVKDLIQESAPRPAIKLPEGAQVDVARFRVTGNKAFAGELLASLVKPWEGRVLDVNGLNDAAGAITRHYQSQGFLLAYAYLPVQKIEQGVIEIAVLEGTVDSVQIVTAQDVRLSDEVIQKYVEGITQTPQVLQSDLERRLLLLNDIPGVVARASFAPGARPGTADVIVTVAEEDPLAYSVDLNNQGSESTGEFRLGALFQFKNLFGLGDSTRLRLQSSPRVSLTTGSLNTRVPFGGQGWSAEAGVSRLSYTLGAPYDSLGARGEANAVHLGLNYQLARSMDENISLTGGYDYKDLADVLDLINNNNKKHSQQVSLGFSASSRSPWLGGGSTQSTLTYSAGTLDWDSVPASGAATGFFSKLSFDASHRQALFADWSVSIRASGQQAFDNLDSSEKYALTGPFGVRAYAPGQASVDSASVIALELRKALALTGRTFSGSLFYDYARGEFAARPAIGVDNDIVLHGFGLGLGWANGADLDFSITAAWRGSPMLSANTDRNPYIYFQVTKGF